MKTRVAELRQAFDEVRDNPVGLPAATAAEVARALNAYLASAYVLYHQYKKHHWVVEGPEFWSIHKLLDEHAAGVLEDADHVAERITALGAVPVSGPARQEEMSVVKPEPEGIFDLRSMLENDLRAEETVIGTLRDSIRLAYDGGDYATAELLQQVLLHHEVRAHNLDHLLGDESLTRGLSSLPAPR